MPHLTRKEGISLVKLLIIGMVIQLFVIGYVFYLAYAGRVGTVNAQRQGCERSKKDRNANAKGWRTAQHRALSQGQPGFAAIYKSIATGLEIRSNIDCTKAFPSASFFP